MPETGRSIRPIAAENSANIVLSASYSTNRHTPDSPAPYREPALGTEMLCRVRHAPRSWVDLYSYNDPDEAMRPTPTRNKKQTYTNRSLCVMLARYCELWGVVWCARRVRPTGCGPQGVLCVAYMSSGTVPASSDPRSRSEALYRSWRQCHAIYEAVRLKVFQLLR